MTRYSDMGGKLLRPSKTSLAGFDVEAHPLLPDWCCVIVDADNKVQQIIDFWPPEEREVQHDPR